MWTPKRGYTCRNLSLSRTLFNSGYCPLPDERKQFSFALIAYWSPSSIACRASYALWRRNIWPRCASRWIWWLILVFIFMSSFNKFLKYAKVRFMSMCLRNSSKRKDCKMNLRKEIDQVIMEWMKGSLVLDTLRVGIALSCCNCRRRTVIKSVFLSYAGFGSSLDQNSDQRTQYNLIS